MTGPLVLPDGHNWPHSYRVEIPRLGKKWITANDRTNWHVKAIQTRLWRDVAAWRSRHLPTLRRAHVIAELRFSDSRRRDPANWAPTAKACLDGLVDALVFDDDDHRHVIGPDMRMGPVVPYAHQALIMHLFVLPEEDT